MKFILGAILALSLSSVVMACEGTPPPNCECDQATGTYVTISASAAASASSTSKATGGNASATGGNATQGQTQSLNNSGNSTASATGGNIQAGAVRNTNSNTNVANGGSGGSATASIASGAIKTVNTQATSIGNVGSTSQVGNTSATANGSGNGTNDTNVTYQAPKEYRNPVNTAYSAPLTSGLDTCVGSVSAGAQTQILGLTFGSTKRDTRCELIKQTHLLVDLHQERAACFRAQLGKEGAEIREAMKEAGAECPPIVEAAPVVIQQQQPGDLVTQDQLRQVEDRITTRIVQK
jgi:hypothetical protein